MGRYIIAGKELCFQCMKSSHVIDRACNIGRLMNCSWDGLDSSPSDVKEFIRNRVKRFGLIDLISMRYKVRKHVVFPVR